MIGDANDKDTGDEARTEALPFLHTGALGTASVLKVMTNYLATANLCAVAEALTVCKKAGLDKNTTYEAIKISSGNSFVHETESQVIGICRCTSTR